MGKKMSQFFLWVKVISFLLLCLNDKSQKLRQGQNKMLNMEIQLAYQKPVNCKICSFDYNFELFQITKTLVHIENKYLDQIA